MQLAQFNFNYVAFLTRKSVSWHFTEPKRQKVGKNTFLTARNLKRDQAHGGGGGTKYIFQSAAWPHDSQRLRWDPLKIFLYVSVRINHS